MVQKRAFLLLVFAYFSNTAPVEKLEDYDISSVDAELGEYFEGDILLSPNQKLAIETDSGITERNGLRASTKRWPNATVVYDIVQEDFDEDQLQMIKDGMNDIMNKSCVKFRPRENDEHAVTIQGSGNGCYSCVGLNKEKHKDDDEEVHQVLNLSPRCFQLGTVVHEMLHTIGFYHMQSTYDRDDYVKIIWENIVPGKEHNFQKYSIDTVTNFDVPYDYGSVMHYSDNAFSKNRNKTIIPLQENVKIGQRKGMSESDIIKLNRMYCEESEIDTLN